MGQTRSVTVIRYVVKNSVEEVCSVSCLLLVGFRSHLPTDSPLIEAHYEFEMGWRLTRETEYCAVAEEEEESGQVHAGGGVRGWGVWVVGCELPSRLERGVGWVIELTARLLTVGWLIRT